MNNQNKKTDKLLLSVVEQLTLLNGSSIARSFLSNDRVFLFGLEGAERLTKNEKQKYMLFTLSIRDILSELGIHPNNNGYAYIIESVKIILDLNTLDIQLRNDVYPLIVRKYELNRESTIDHNIRNAIITAYRDYQRDPDSNNMGIFRKCPSNKIFIYYVTENVWHRMNTPC